MAAKTVYYAPNGDTRTTAREYTHAVIATRKDEPTKLPGAIAFSGSEALAVKAAADFAKRGWTVTVEPVSTEKPSAESVTEWVQKHASREALEAVASNKEEAEMPAKQTAAETTARAAAFEKGRALGMDHAEAYDYAASVVAHNKGETEMVAKKTAETTPDATPEQIREDFDALLERLTAVAISGDTEGVDTLKGEGEALVGKLPTKDRTKLRAQLRKAAEAKPTAPATTEVAVVETADYTKVAGLSELVTMGADKVREGIKLAQKASTTARDVATVMLDMRLRITNKQGVPDLKCASHEAKRAASDMYKAASEAMEGDDAHRELTLKALQRAVNYQMSDVVVRYVEALDNSPEELPHFAKVLAANPEMSPTEAVRVFYKISDKSAIDKDREKNELQRKAAAAIEAGEGGEGGGEGGEGAGEGASELEKLIALLDKAEKAIASAVKGAGKVSDEDKAAVKERLSDLLDAGALGKAKL
jgi:hypothetical protein